MQIAATSRPTVAGAAPVQAPPPVDLTQLAVAQTNAKMTAAAGAALGQATGELTGVLVDISVQAGWIFGSRQGSRINRVTSPFLVNTA